MAKKGRSSEPAPGRFGLVRLAVLVYGSLLWLLPPEFRRGHGEDAALLFGRRLEEAARGGTGALVRAAAGGLVDLAVTAVVEWIEWFVDIGLGRGAMAGSVRANAVEWVGRQFWEARMAGRTLRRAVGYSGAAAGLVAVGVGATLTVASLLRAVVWDDLPFPDSDRVVTVWMETEDFARSPLTVPGYRFLAESAPFFETVAARWSGGALLVRAGRAREVRVGYVTAGYFEILGVEPRLGRFPDPGEPGVVVSDALWRGELGGDPDILGSSLRLGENVVTVAGVMPPEVVGLPTFEGGPDRSDMWRPLPEGWLDGDDWVLAWLRVVARVRPEVAPGEAQARVDELLPQLALAADRAPDSFRYRVRQAKADLTAEARPVLFTLGVAVLLLMLVATSNVASLSLQRGVARAPELALRSALGGSTSHIARQLVYESLWVCGVGGLMGALASVLALDVITSATAAVPGMERVRIDLSFGLLALGIATLVALFGGASPLMRAAREAPAVALATGRTGTGGGRRRAGDLLTTGQVAVTFGLLAATGVLLQTAVSQARAWPGWTARDAVTFKLHPAARFETGAEALTYFQELERRLGDLPGGARVGFANMLPLHGGIYGGPWGTRDTEPATGGRPEADFRFVSPGHLEALGGRLVEGRFLSADDGPDAMVVDDVFARDAWPGQRAVGKEVWTGTLGREGEWSTVVGVVEEQRHESIGRPGSGTVFFPAWAGIGDGWPYFPGGGARVVVRPTGPLELDVEQIRSVVEAVDPLSTVSELGRVEGVVRRATASIRVTLLVVAFFAVAAILLAGTGLYGVVAFAVGRRTTEVGVRKALGAGPGSVFSTFAAFGLRSLGAGLALGAVVALAINRALGLWIPELAALDWLVIVASAVTLGLTGAAAILAPASRAARVDPLTVLRRAG